MKESGKGWINVPMTTLGVNMWSPNWYHKSIVHFDAEKLADTLAEAKVDVFFCWQGFTHDHFGISYFPTRMGPVHRNLGDRNHAQEMIDALHKRDIRIIGYYSYPDWEVWKAHPDWRQLDSRGEEIREGSLIDRFGALCPNSPYRELLVARVFEIVQSFDLDGMYMPDSMQFAPSPPGCYCPYCRRKYKDQTGKTMPVFTGGYDENWHEFLQWRYNCIREIFYEISQGIRRRKPNMIVIHLAFDMREVNGWARGDDYEESTQYDDLVTSIASWTSSKDRETVRRYIDSIWTAGFLTKHLRGISGRPVHMHFGRFAYDREYQTQPEHEMRLGAYSVVLNGGNPAIADNLNPDGSFNPIAYERIGRVYAEIKDKLEYLKDATEVPVAALYYSKKSHDYYDTIHSNEYRYLHSVLGAYKTLLETHIPFQIVSARTVDLESLSPFVIVLIPDAVMMSDAEISVIEQYVRDGGSVICTGMTSLVDDRGRRRPDFGLRNLLKVRFESTLNYKISYITHINDVLSAGIDTRDPIIFRGMQAKVVPDADAEVGAIIGYPASEIALPRTITYASDVSFEGESDFPAAVLTEVGKGRCVYFAGEMTKNYGVYGYPNLRLLLENAIQWCCRQHLPIELEAPLNVETNLFRQGDRYLIHLLNYTTDGMLRVVYDRGGPFGTTSVPCGRITVRLRLNGKKPKNVYIASSKQELKHDAKEGMLGIEVPGLDTYEIVVVEC